MKIKRIKLFIPLTLFIISIALVFPVEKIYIKESRPTEFLPEERPYGLIEASNMYITFSYGTLLHQKEEEFFVQAFVFNSSEQASSFFNNTIKTWENSGYEIYLTSSDGDKEASVKKIIFIEGKEMEKEFSLVVLRENKMFFISGNRKNIDRVKRWLLD